MSDAGAAASLAPRIAVTSVVRGASVGQASGLLRVVDLHTRRVLLRTPVPESVHRASDPNPRGGVRGARGAGVEGDRLVVANSERLFVVDRSWRLVSEITHPWMSAIHDLRPEPAGIWVTCTNCDLLLRVSWAGEPLDSWSWRGDRDLVRSLSFASVPRFRGDLDYRRPGVMRGGVHNIVHLNAVTRGRDGLLVSFGRVLSAPTLRRRRAGAVLGRAATMLGVPRRRASRRSVAIDSVPGVPGSSFVIVGLSEVDEPLGGERSARIVMGQNGIAVPNHNLLEAAPGRLVYNDSNRGALVAYDLGRGAVERAAPVPGSPSFPRGLARLPDGTFLVGSQAPPAVHRIDLEAERVLSSLRLEGPDRESVYGIAILPDSFDDPRPPAFAPR